ncbi:MAG: lysine 2,3-aminomutase [Spirochaetales bacterium]|nr:lysine 2,3-aminomutase [Spirochaetales bacterium]
MMYTEQQKKVSERLSITDSKTQWQDWRWQLQHSIKNIEMFEEVSGITLKEEDRKKFEQTVEKFPMNITPYYLSLIDFTNWTYDPVFMQSVPSYQELSTSKYEMNDPLAEDKDSPVPYLTHRYPDRVLVHVSNTCSMYCRHCTRKRKVGDRDSIPSLSELSKAIDYIKSNTNIRDVLLSGGDPLMLPDDYLDALLDKIHSIPHVEIIRIGTRMPVVLPYRITDNLVELLKKYAPLFINTHFNHPQEITRSSKAALKKLADAGIPLGNQTVLLAGVNDCPKIIKRLNHLLLMNRVRPYYIYQCDLSEGLGHFRTPVGKGIEIMESLIGHTSGLAVPTYVIDAPGGGGKIPVMPNYLISWSTNKVILRNYEGVITTYKEPDSYEPNFCNRDCENCDRQLNIEEGIEHETVGIEKLMCNVDTTIALTPAGTERMNRRK